MTPSLTRVFAALVLVLTLAACGGNEQADTDAPDAAPAEAGDLVLYSGRSQTLVEPVLDRFREETGIDVQARYGRDAELLAALEEEGPRSEADVFWANTAGALGAANNAGLLTDLPDSLLQRPGAYVPSSGRWVPVTVRFRVLAFNPDAVSESDLPTSVMALPEMEQFRGRIGWTPTYSSFQDFVTAMQLVHGEDSTRSWLQGVRALEPKAYPSNTPMLEAMLAGEIDVALTNHYYVRRITEGGGENAESVAIHRFDSGDVGNLALVTGAGLLENGAADANAARLLSFLLSEEAQSMLAENVREYPVLRDAPVPSYLLPFDEAARLGPEIDFERLRDIDGTLRLLRDEELL